MKNEDREQLIAEQKLLDNKIKSSSFADPKDYRRIQEITSLLLTDGENGNLKLKNSKPRKSERVTSFTRDRR